MTDDGKPKRPNSKYKLSNENISAYDKENLNFHYNRERRLEKAPQIVIDTFYSDTRQNKFGLMRPLVGSRPRAMLFYTIIFLCVIILFLSIMGYFDTSYLIENNKLQVSGTVFEDTTIVVLRKSMTGKNPVYTGAVNIAVTIPAKTEGEEQPVFYHRVFFSLEQEESYRFVVPFEAPELLMVVQTEKASVNVRFKPE